MKFLFLFFASFSAPITLASGAGLCSIEGEIARVQKNASGFWYFEILVLTSQQGYCLGNLLRNQRLLVPFDPSEFISNRVKPKEVESNPYIGKKREKGLNVPNLLKKGYRGVFTAYCSDYMGPEKSVESCSAWRPDGRKRLPKVNRSFGLHLFDKARKNLPK